MKDEADLHEQYARVIRMCVGTKVRPEKCVKFSGQSWLHDWAFTSNPAEYSFALAIVEDRPVFEGDVLYDDLGIARTVSSYVGDPNFIQICHDFIKQAHRSFPIANLSWNPPKKKTFTLNGEELPLPDGKGEGYALTLPFDCITWIRHCDMFKTRSAFIKLLSGE